MREQRKLAAVLAADVVGYSRLMGRDEAGTLARLKEHRAQRLEPTLARNGGRLVKLTGDGALAEFPSAVDALRAAIEFQQAVDQANATQPEEQRVAFRVGLHVGDLIVDGDDLYGDGVNVAARLEGEAAPGGIVISGALHEAAAGRLEARFIDLGRLSLKNIERQVQAYRVEPSEARQPTSVTVASGHSAPAASLPLPDKPSVAVLPFQNMSGDPEQEYFADGMVEDIITALSRFKSLFVIARNSSFTYKDRAVDIKQVGRELGVRYVLEGSVRKAGGKVRISGQLIDCATGAHLWADRFDGSLEDVFELQDQVTASVVAAVAPRVTQAEIERVRRKPVDNLDAYDCFLRGLAYLNVVSKEAEDGARALFYRAIDLDANFATPYGLAARSCSMRKAQDWSPDPEANAREVKRLAGYVQAVGQDDAGRYAGQATRSSSSAATTTLARQ
jgi:adenylate cyclase